LNIFTKLHEYATGPTRTPTPIRTSSPTSEDPRADVGVFGARKSAERAAARAEVGVRRRARPVQLATSRTLTTILADLSADFCPTRALFLARMSVGDARVYTYTCTVHDKLSCTRLENYTIGASLMSVSVSVSVSVPWGSRLCKEAN